MSAVKAELDNGILVVSLSGDIDSLNAQQVEEEIRERCRDAQPQSVVLDLRDLHSTSSAGLRVFLRLKQDIDDTRIVNAGPAVYDVLTLTGFTEIMDVQKAYRVLSVEGCEMIGQGANGRVYRIDRDTIVKVYTDPDSLEDIRRERELARTAFVAGLPTAISYDIVRIEGGGYGSVYELLNATSLANLLVSGEKTVDEVAEISVKLLKLIHSTVAKPGSVPDMRTVAAEWVDKLEGRLPADQYGKLRALFGAVPEDMHLMHGDYHLRNVMVQDGEALLIDMDTLCHGHPVFELAAMYNACRGFGETDPSVIERFLGISAETAFAFWKKNLELYLGTTDEAVLRAVENKVKVISHARILRRAYRRSATEPDGCRAEIENSRRILAELLPVVDTLLF